VTSNSLESAFTGLSASLDSMGLSSRGQTVRDLSGLRGFGLAIDGPPESKKRQPGDWRYRTRGILLPNAYYTLGVRVCQGHRRNKLELFDGRGSYCGFLMSEPACSMLPLTSSVFTSDFCPASTSTSVSKVR
jgi:hypothetical protein